MSRGHKRNLVNAVVYWKFTQSLQCPFAWSEFFKAFPELLDRPFWWNILAPYPSDEVLVRLSKRKPRPLASFLTLESDHHGHLTQRLARCLKVREHAEFELLPQALFFVLHAATPVTVRMSKEMEKPWLPTKRCHCLHLNDYRTPPQKWPSTTSNALMTRAGWLWVRQKWSETAFFLLLSCKRTTPSKWILPKMP